MALSQISDLLIIIVSVGVGSLITILGQRRLETWRRKKEIYEILRRDLTDLIHAYVPIEKGLEEKLQASFSALLKEIPKRIKDPKIRKAAKEAVLRIQLEHGVSKIRRLYDFQIKLTKLSQDVVTYGAHLNKNLITSLHGIVLYFDKLELGTIIDQFYRYGGLEQSKLDEIRNLIRDAISRMR